MTRTEARIILVIDDDPQILESSRLYLQFAGFTVLTSLDGSEGTRLAKSQIPDLIICDVFMSDVNGYDVLRAIRSDEQTLFTPFIFMTGNPDRGLQRQGMELGADDFLHKPFSQSEILVATHTQLMKREKFHRAYTAQREALQRTKRLLSLMVAHELRTPLIAITMSKDLLAMQLGELSVAEMQELLDSMDHGTRRLRHLVEQMVLLTQLETELLDRNFILRSGVPMQVSMLVGSALNLAREFDYDHLQANFTLKPYEGHDTVLCDPGSLKHALAEIIRNAVIYGNQTAREITISQWQQLETVRISILDNGRGMTPNEIRQAMEVFEQINRDVHEQQGMGIGLPLAKRIIEVHGGNLEILSVPRKGTQVLITLPLSSAWEVSENWHLSV